MKHSRFLNITILIHLFVFGSSYSQKVSQLKTDANQCFENNDFANAKNYFLKLYERDSINLDYIKSLAICSYKIYHLSDAELYFEKLFKSKDSKKYDDLIIDYAQTLKMLGNYKKAKKEFEKHYKRIKNKNKQIAQSCLNEIASCNMSLTTKNSQDTVLLLGKNINSEYSENAPFFWENQLIFSSTIDGENYEVFKSDYKNFDFQQKKKLFLSSKEKNFYSNFIVDSNTFYCSECFKEKGIYNCKLLKGEYTSENLINIDDAKVVLNQINNTITQPSIGYIDGVKYLFFVSDMNGTNGGKDIFYSRITKTGDFEEPKNVNSKLNTTGDEITPYYCIDCKALFFSSNNQIGFGGFDIYKSRYENGVFSNPENLNRPINSSLNDIYYSCNHTINSVFFSSNRGSEKNNSESFCCNDIYYSKIPNKTKLDTTYQDTSAELETSLIAKIKTHFPLYLYFDNDEPDKKTLDIFTQKKYDETVNAYLLNKDEYLKKINKRNAVAEENEFETFFNDSVLNSFNRLNICLDDLKFLLELKCKIILKIKGFSSPLASEIYNRNLAKRRISSVINYISNYNNSIFKSYIETKKLIVEEIEIGEDVKNIGVSDDPNDVKKSIYSIRAALQRKISIEKIEINK